MLRRRVIFIVVLMGATLPSPSPAKCATCFTNPCTSAAFCGRGCVCMKKPFETMGQCVSFE